MDESWIWYKEASGVRLGFHVAKIAYTSFLSVLMESVVVGGIPLTRKQAPVKFDTLCTFIEKQMSTEGRLAYLHSKALPVLIHHQDNI